MKVNIAGVGLVPKVGLLAPVYGKDLTKDTIAVILNYSSFRVYSAASGVQITKSNIDEVFNSRVPVRSVPKKEEASDAIAHPDERPMESAPVPDISEPKMEEEYQSVDDETNGDAAFEDLPEISEDPETEMRTAEPIAGADNKDEGTSVETNNGGNNVYRKKNKKRH